MKKVLFFGVVLIGFGFILSACGPSQTKQVGLEFDSDKLSTKSASSNSEQPVQTDQTMPEIKQLEDFKEIVASQATIHTTKGDITVELYRELTPITTANFLNLAESGFYDGIVFHRVIPDFMAQVGDPKTKDESLKAEWGTGGPGYTIPDEFNSELTHDSAGILSMANTGRPSSGGSQFFITHGPTPHLDGKHTVFGKVTKGLDILMQIEIGDKINSISYQ